MKPKYRNLFLAFGILAIGVMLATFDVDYAELVVRLKRAGIWLPAIVGIWVVVYFFNALAFQLIVNSCRSNVLRRGAFIRVYALIVVVVDTVYLDKRVLVQPSESCNPVIRRRCTRCNRSY